MSRFLPYLCLLTLGGAPGFAGPTEDALKVGEEAKARGDYTGAVTAWVNAYNERSMANTANDETCAKLLFEAGSLFSALGRHEESRSCFEKLVALRTKLNGDQDPATAVAMSRLAAAIANGGGDPDKAESHARLAEELLAKAGDSFVAERLTAMGNLGGILLMRKDRLPAHEQFVAVLGLCEKHPGMFPDAEVNALNSMAAIAEFFGRFKDQIQYLKRALEVRRRHQGPADAKTIEARLELAAALTNSGDGKGAREAYVSLVNDLKQTKGVAENKELMKKWTLAEYRLAYVESSLGNPDAVLGLLNSSLERAKTGFGEFDPNLLPIYLDLARLHLSRKNYDQGVRCYQAVLDIRRRVLGPDHKDTKETQEILNQLYAEVEKIRPGKKAPRKEPNP